MVARPGAAVALALMMLVPALLLLPVAPVGPAEAAGVAGVAGGNQAVLLSGGVPWRPMTPAARGAAFQQWAQPYLQQYNEAAASGSVPASIQGMVTGRSLVELRLSGGGQGYFALDLDGAGRVGNLTSVSGPAAVPGSQRTIRTSEATVRGLAGTDDPGTAFLRAVADGRVRIEANDLGDQLTLGIGAFAANAMARFGGSKYDVAPDQRKTITFQGMDGQLFRDTLGRRIVVLPERDDAHLVVDQNGAVIGQTSPEELRLLGTDPPGSDVRPSQLGGLAPPRIDLPLLPLPMPGDRSAGSAPDFTLQPSELEALDGFAFTVQPDADAAALTADGVARWRFEDGAGGVYEDDGPLFTDLPVVVPKPRPREDRDRSDGFYLKPTLTVWDDAGVTRQRTYHVHLPTGDLDVGFGGASWEDLPTALVEGNYSRVWPGDTVEFHLRGMPADDAVPIVRYTWFDGIGGTTSTHGGKANRTYTEPGTYRYQLTVTDAFGRAGTTIGGVRVDPNLTRTPRGPLALPDELAHNGSQPAEPNGTGPRAILTFADSGVPVNVGREVVFTLNGVRASDGQRLTGWSLDLGGTGHMAGNGEPVNIVTAPMAYPTPGAFPASLTVRDSYGRTHTDTVTIVVPPRNVTGGIPVQIAKAQNESADRPTAILAKATPVRGADGNWSVLWTLDGLPASDGVAIAYYVFRDGAGVTTFGLGDPDGLTMGSVYRGSGHYGATLLVTDRNGRSHEAKVLFDLAAPGETLEVIFVTEEAADKLWDGPEADLFPDRREGAGNLTVTFTLDGRPSRRDRAPIVSWTFFDGKTFEHGTGDPDGIRRTVNFTLGANDTAPRTFTPRLEVTDAKGRTSVERIEVRVTVPGQQDFGTRARSSDPDFNPVGAGGSGGTGSGSGNGSGNATGNATGGGVPPGGPVGPSIPRVNATGNTTGNGTSTGPPASGGGEGDPLDEPPPVIYGEELDCPKPEHDGVFTPTQGVWQDDYTFKDRPGRREMKRVGPALWFAYTPMVHGRETLLFGARGGSDPLVDDKRIHIEINGTGYGSYVPVKVRFMVRSAAGSYIIGTTAPEYRAPLGEPCGPPSPIDIEVSVWDGFPKNKKPFKWPAQGPYTLTAEVLHADGRPTGVQVNVGGNTVETVPPDMVFMATKIEPNAGPAADAALLQQARDLADDVKLNFPEWLPMRNVDTTTRVGPIVYDLSVPARYLPSNDSRGDFLRDVLPRIATSAGLLSGAGRVVAVVDPDPWYRLLANRTYGNGTAVGAAWSMSQKFIMTDATLRADSMAHEYVHTMPAIWSSAEMLAECEHDYHNNASRVAHGIRVIERRVPGARWAYADPPIMGPVGGGFITQCTYRHMLDVMQAPPDPPVILVQGLVGRAGDWGELAPLYQVPDGVVDLPEGSGSWAVQLRDAQGAFLGSWQLTPQWEIPDTDIVRDVAPFAWRVPDVPGTARVELHGPTGLLDAVDYTRNRPTVNFTSVARVPGSDPPRAAVAWQGQDADGDALWYTVLYSEDRGKTWVPVVMESNATRVELPVPAKPQDVAMRVIVTDGTLSSEARADAAALLASGAAATPPPASPLVVLALLVAALVLRRRWA